MREFSFLIWIWRTVTLPHKNLRRYFRCCNCTTVVSRSVLLCHPLICCTQPFEMYCHLTSCVIPSVPSCQHDVWYAADYILWRHRYALGKRDPRTETIDSLVRTRFKIEIPNTCQNTKIWIWAWNSVALLYNVQPSHSLRKLESIIKSNVARAPIISNQLDFIWEYFISSAIWQERDYL